MDQENKPIGSGTSFLLSNFYILFYSYQRRNLAISFDNLIYNADDFEVDNVFYSVKSKWVVFFFV